MIPHKNLKSRMEGNDLGTVKLLIEMPTQYYILKRKKAKAIFNKIVNNAEMPSYYYYYSVVFDNYA